jgi:hypothetical protein
LLVAGLLVMAHVYCSGSKSTSNDALPSTTTVVLTNTVWSSPALASGALLLVVTVTVSAADATVPSCTMSCAT